MKFINNKYTKWYYQIIQNANESVDEYTENHHIIPKSMGGSNDKDNLVALTAREHYVAHLLLMKMTEGEDKRKMVGAFAYMAYVRNNHTKQRYTSRLFEYHKKIRAKALSESMSGTGNPRYGATMTADTKEKIGASKRGKKWNGSVDEIEKRRKQLLTNNPMNDPILKAKAAHNHAKTYILTAPDGSEFEVHNIAQWCRNNPKFDKKQLSAVARGEQKTHRGYKCRIKL